MEMREASEWEAVAIVGFIAAVLVPVICIPMMFIGQRFGIPWIDMLGLGLSYLLTIISGICIMLGFCGSICAYAEREMAEIGNRVYKVIWAEAVIRIVAASVLTILANYIVKDKYGVYIIIGGALLFGIVPALLATIRLIVINNDKGDK